jgi:hypothetical protein
MFQLEPDFFIQAHDKLRLIHIEKFSTLLFIFSWNVEVTCD